MIASPRDLEAPSHDPAADGLVWWRRGLAQGAGYFLPSAAFAAIPLFYLGDHPWLRVALIVALSLVVVGLFVGTTLVAHWPEWRRWVWLGGLIAAVVALDVLSGSQARAAYYVPYVTASAASLIAWRHARTVIVGVSLVALAIALHAQSLLGVVMAAGGFSLGFSIGLGIENDRARRALRDAEERTAVLAVAAERERIGRDLHDILGHSLTAIAVKSDLARRLIGRDDEAARSEVDALASIAREALADVRATASGMREVRLASEIASARSVLDAAGIESTTPAAVPTLDATTSELLGYVVREAVTNVVRHSGASRCTIVADDRSVTVSDDGVGIRGRAPRVGLAGLSRRIAEAGGTLEVTSGGGVTVRAEVPTAVSAAVSGGGPT